MIFLLKRWVCVICDFSGSNLLSLERDDQRTEYATDHPRILHESRHLIVEYDVHYEGHEHLQTVDGLDRATLTRLEGMSHARRSYQAQDAGCHSLHDITDRVCARSLQEVTSRQNYGAYEVAVQVELDDIELELENVVLHHK